MGFWNAIVNAAKNQTVRKAGRFMSYPLTHPGQTVQGAGAATKTAVVGGGLGYLAWESIANDKPVIETASEVLVGKETTDKVGNVVGATVDGVEKTVNSAGQVIENAGNILSGANNSGGGLGNFFQGLFSGNGFGMIGDFFKNIGKGNVSGLSIAGLVGAAFLCFGRFGWLGKIAGALLGMMVVGNNFNMNKIMGGDRQMTSAEQERSGSQEQQMQTPAASRSEPDEGQGAVIHRGR